MWRLSIDRPGDVLQLERETGIPPMEWIWRNRSVNQLHNKGSAMTTPAELRKDREQLVAMIRELQTNRIILDGLLKCYGMFLFTGGVVPREPWGLDAVTSYLQCPFAADRISIREVERYRHLVEATMEPRLDVAAGPRTLRCRKDLGDVSDRASSEIQTLETALESILAKLLKDLKELESPFPAPEIDVKRAKIQSERS